MSLNQRQQDTIRKYAPGGFRVNVPILGAFGIGQECVAHMLATGEDYREVPYDPTYDGSTYEKVYVQGKMITTTHESSFRGDDPEDVQRARIQRGEAFIFVYDVTKRESFAKLEEEFERFCSVFNIQLTDVHVGRRSLGTRIIDKLSGRLLSPPTSPPYILVANRIDLPRKDWAVTPEEGQAFCERIGAGAFVQMSDLTGEGSSKDILVDLLSHVLFRKAYAAGVRDKKSRFSKYLDPGARE
ncbi:hypothetical protein GGS26DRAFT_14843 [Hypomontagnella submonticulosa]|nr:hypothetical protein GGS26DRAFT_14843 [Hypomontagnella submonticulosa]